MHIIMLFNSLTSLGFEILEMMCVKYLLKHTALNTWGLLYYYQRFYYFLHSGKENMIGHGHHCLRWCLGVQMLWNQADGVEILILLAM